MSARVINETIVRTLKRNSLQWPKFLIFGVKWKLEPQQALIAEAAKIRA